LSSSFNDNKANTAAQTEIESKVKSLWGNKMEDTTLRRFQDCMMTGLHGKFPQEQINAAFDGYEDAWLSWANLSPDTVIPRIPRDYMRQHEEDRIIYVAGFTFACDCKHFLRWARELAKGDIERTITIVDLESECTFRWLVMTTAQEAAKVLKAIHGLKVTMYKPRGDGTEDELTFMLRACQSASDTIVHYPPTTASLRENSVPDSPAVPTVHGHPSPHGHSVRGPVWTGNSSNSSSSVSIQENTAQSIAAHASDVSQTVEKTTATPASWANIAISANPDSEIINLHPPRHSIGPRVKPAGRIPNAPGSVSDEPLIEQARLVFLLNMPLQTTLQNVSDAVLEGPLRSIIFGMDDIKEQRYVGILFQYAQDAETFYQVLCKERADSRPGRFKFVVDAIRGDPFPMDATIKSMGPPTFASRRLTLVKSKFFFMVGEKQLRAFCEKLVQVPREQIQLIWLYNGGNATIVFADVQWAIKVKTKLDEQANGAGTFDRQTAATWAGLQTTFSKDPCVAQLELKSAMPPYP
jgi:hypothetical protein